MLVGSVGRILTGALTDRYGGRLMFTIMLLASSVPVLLVALAGALGSYTLLLVFGFLLGIAGTTFAIGIPFVNAWYEAVGAGSPPASSARAWAAPRCRPSSPRAWCSRFGYVATHVIIAVALAVVAVDRLVADAGLARSGSRTPTRCSRSSRPRPSWR